MTQETTDIHVYGVFYNAGYRIMITNYWNSDRP